jgi:hypothetical protein
MIVPNIAMSLDNELIKKARKIAIDKDTSLTGLIRKYLQELVEQEEQSNATAAAELESLFRQSKAVVGRKTWSRDDLHDRR